MHTEDIEHFGRAPEADGSALLTNRKSREEDRHDAILAEWETVIRMPCDLKNELAISTFEE